MIRHAEYPSGINIFSATAPELTLFRALVQSTDGRLNIPVHPFYTPSKNYEAEEISWEEKQQIGYRHKMTSLIETCLSYQFPMVILQERNQIGELYQRFRYRKDRNSLLVAPTKTGASSPIDIDDRGGWEHLASLLQDAEVNHITVSGKQGVETAASEFSRLGFDVEFSPFRIRQPKLKIQLKIPLHPHL